MSRNVRRQNPANAIRFAWLQSNGTSWGVATNAPGLFLSASGATGIDRMSSWLAANAAARQSTMNASEFVARPVQISRAMAVSDWMVATPATRTTITPLADRSKRTIAQPINVSRITPSPTTFVGLGYRMR